MQLSVLFSMVVTVLYLFIIAFLIIENRDLPRDDGQKYQPLLNTAVWDKNKTTDAGANSTTPSNESTTEHFTYERPRDTYTVKIPFKFPARRAKKDSDDGKGRRSGGGKARAGHVTSRPLDNALKRTVPRHGDKGL
ncbi:uncharacterized protein LOC144157714 [Haemaphysalis longicornis]